MKGKVAFVFGAAVGYVLGTRAGRERYEQIKRGARTVWNTAPVQRGVQVVRSAAQQRVDRVKDAAIQAGKNLMSRPTSGSAAGTGVGSDRAAATKPGSGGDQS